MVNRWQGQPDGAADRVVDLGAPAERFDGAVDVVAALTGVLDKVELLLAADLLDADEHGWCPCWDGDTIPNPAESRVLAGFDAKKAGHLAPQFHRGARHPRNTAGFRAGSGRDCGSWVRPPSARMTTFYPPKRRETKKILKLTLL
jgi:hypothetical protein